MRSKVAWLIRLPPERQAIAITMTTITTALSHRVRRAGRRMLGIITAGKHQKWQGIAPYDHYAGSSGRGLTAILYMFSVWFGDGRLRIAPDQDIGQKSIVVIGPAHTPTSDGSGNFTPCPAEEASHAYILSFYGASARRPSEVR